MSDQDMNDIDNDMVLNEDTNPDEQHVNEDLVAPMETREDKGQDPVIVEDLPLDKRIELAKNCPNPFGTVKPGLWIDAMDTINAWLSAQIEEVEENAIRVHFDGWPAKWDEWMKITSYKVAPFRKNSEGYTGQTKVAIRKEQKDVQYYKDMIEKIDICIKNNLKGLGPIDTTQFYRGDVFVTLDHLMSMSYEPADDAMLEVAIEYIKKAIELVCAYIRLIPDMLTSLNEAKIEPDLYIVDENVAVAQCYYEFAEMLKTIFCMNPRTLRFYLKHDRPPQDLKTSICQEFRDRDYDQEANTLEDLEFDDLREMVFKNKDLDFGLFHEFLDHFQQHGGFDTLRTALKSVVPTDNGPSLPLDLIPTLTCSYKN